MLTLTKTCVDCENMLPLEAFSKMSKNNPLYRGYCKKCAVIRQKKWLSNNRDKRAEYYKSDRYKELKKISKKRNNKKIKLVFVSGGRCILCGYNACLDALVFHHTDPSTKEFSIAKIYNITKALEEIKKCILVCGNCHYEIHAGLHPKYIVIQENKILKPMAIYNNNLRNAIKNQCVEYKGGKCERCKYDRCNKSLCFHHLDQNIKEPNASSLFRGNFEKSKAELDKCELLCINCHAEAHAEFNPTFS